MLFLRFLAAEQHPLDDFTTIRFSARIARPGSDGDDDNIPTAVQPIELCFHCDFVVDPDQPLSLHLSGPRREILYYHPPQACLPRPSPPCYIHEIDDIIDLSLAHQTPPPPPPSLSSVTPPRGRLFAARTSNLVFLCVGLLTGIVVAWLLHHGAFPSKPTPAVSSSTNHVDSDSSNKSSSTSHDNSKIIRGPDGFIYNVRLVNRTEPLNLYRAAIPLDRLRRSLPEPLYDALAVPAEPLSLLADVGRLLSDTCLNATSFFAHTKTHSDTRNITFACQHLHSRLSNLRALWVPLRVTSAASLFESSSHGSPIAALLLREASNTASFLTAYREAFIFRPSEHLPWPVALCQFCSSKAATRDVVRPYDIIADSSNAHSNDSQTHHWHFACDGSFSTSDPDNLPPLSVPGIVSRLESWARNQSARRYSGLQSAIGKVALDRRLRQMLDMPDMALPVMPAEGELLAITRQVAELSMGIQELLERLSQYDIGAFTSLTADDDDNTPVNK
ncbi:hypothetical protein LY76DRAFT_649658 [Colletotrichum caudatum]|nr:hypothetical protein LY76DRAFT_649658 [Colletotrichum caudatum]